MHKSGFARKLQKKTSNYSSGGKNFIRFKHSRSINSIQNRGRTHNGMERLLHRQRGTKRKHEYDEEDVQNVDLRTVDMYLVVSDGKKRIKFKTVDIDNSARVYPVDRVLEGWTNEGCLIAHDSLKNIPVDRTFVVDQMDVDVIESDPSTSGQQKEDLKQKLWTERKETIIKDVKQMEDMADDDEDMIDVSSVPLPTDNDDNWEEDDPIQIQPGPSRQMDYNQPGPSRQMDYNQPGSSRQMDYNQSGSSRQMDYNQPGSSRQQRVDTSPMEMEEEDDDYDIGRPTSLETIQKLDPVQQQPQRQTQQPTHHGPTSDELTEEQIDKLLNDYELEQKQQNQQQQKQNEYESLVHITPDNSKRIRVHRNENVNMIPRPILKQTNKYKPSMSKANWSNLLDEEYSDKGGDGDRYNDSDDDENEEAIDSRHRPIKQTNNRETIDYDDDDGDYSEEEDGPVYNQKEQQISPLNQWRRRRRRRVDNNTDNNINPSMATDIKRRRQSHRSVESRYEQQRDKQTRSGRIEFDNNPILEDPDNDDDSDPVIINLKMKNIWTYNLTDRDIDIIYDLKILMEIINPLVGFLNSNDTGRNLIPAYRIDKQTHCSNMTVMNYVFHHLYTRRCFKTRVVKDICRTLTAVEMGRRTDPQMINIDPVPGVQKRSVEDINDYFFYNNLLVAKVMTITGIFQTFAMESGYVFNLFSTVLMACNVLTNPRFSSLQTVFKTKINQGISNRVSIFTDNVLLNIFSRRELVFKKFTSPTYRMNLVKKDMEKYLTEDFILAIGRLKTQLPVDEDNVSTVEHYAARMRILKNTDRNNNGTVWSSSNSTSANSLINKISKDHTVREFTTKEYLKKILRHSFYLETYSSVLYSNESNGALVNSFVNEWPIYIHFKTTRH